MKQERIPIAQVREFISQRTDFRNVFAKLDKTE
jgi:hypothetical protein